MWKKLIWCFCRTYLPHENEFYPSGEKRNDQYMTKNRVPVGLPECFSCMTDRKSFNDKIRRKRRSRKKINDHDVMPIPVQQDSDSAFSLSPLISEVSNGFYNSRSGDMSLDESVVVNENHTYVNMLNSESTQFENMTQVEKFFPTTLTITNIWSNAPLQTGSLRLVEEWMNTISTVVWKWFHSPKLINSWISHVLFRGFCDI